MEPHLPGAVEVVIRGPGLQAVDADRVLPAARDRRETEAQVFLTDEAVEACVLDVECFYDDLERQLQLREYSVQIGAAVSVLFSVGDSKTESGGVGLCHKDAHGQYRHPGGKTDIADIDVDSIVLEAQAVKGDAPAQTTRDAAGRQGAAGGRFRLFPQPLRAWFRVQQPEPRGGGKCDGGGGQEQQYAAQAHSSGVPIVRW